MTKKLTKSLEDYIEAVLVLVRKGRVARVRDIARRLGVGSPSVTAALKALSKRGLVNYDPYQFVTLTDRGQAAAEKVQRCHQVIRGFLTDVLCVDRDAAEDYACRMEHVVDAALLARLGEFVAFARQADGAAADWLKPFRRQCSRAKAPKARAAGAPARRASRKPAKEAL